MLQFILVIFIFCFFIYIIMFILSILLQKRNYTFDTYFGVPGSGKTTFAAYLAKKRQKKNKSVYSNVAIKNCYAITRNDIGCFDMSNGLILCDEAGIEFNSRNYSKNFTDKQISFLKSHRHYCCDLAFFSQYWNDIDVTLRRLSTRMFLLKKSFIPFFIKRKKIGKRIGIDDLTKQVIDEYYFVPFVFGGVTYIFCPLLWKMFDTHERVVLPKKEFRKYG